MSEPTFAECFCAQNQIKPADFARCVLKRSLTPQTRWVRWFLPLIEPAHFTADFDLIYSVGELRRLREFPDEVTRFNAHPANCGWLRRKLGLRVSSRRLRGLVRTTLPRRGDRVATALDAAVQVEPARN